MRKLWLCLFYALCVFTIVFSLFWMALPRLPLGRADSAEETPVPSLPSISVQAVPETGSTTYYLCDEGGRVVVWQCDASGCAAPASMSTSCRRATPCASSRGYASPARPSCGSCWKI